MQKRQEGWGSAEAVCLALLPLGVAFPESWVAFFPAVGLLPAASGSFPSPEQSLGPGPGPGPGLCLGCEESCWGLEPLLRLRAFRWELSVLKTSFQRTIIFFFWVKGEKCSSSSKWKALGLPTPGTFPRSFLPLRAAAAPCARRKKRRKSGWWGRARGRWEECVRSSESMSAPGWNSEGLLASEGSGDRVRRVQERRARPAGWRARWPCSMVPGSPGVVWEEEKHSLTQPWPFLLLRTHRSSGESSRPRQETEASQEPSLLALLPCSGLSSNAEPPVSAFSRHHSGLSMGLGACAINSLLLAAVSSILLDRTERN
ncbi:uncharacterized protein LOC132538562 [Erinaceus europaeus]|uniref:Uncharacterized protein LOC132538562 n=1 Tax=Erinaceus europaeus TaxID=9365 RepID=A0ABM3XDR5_ERIEU|nr:uncharacterized protein LOC132538562 [Erinaceus europaeus]